MKEYVPYQHIARPLGCEHTICFANVELWMDELPESLLIGNVRWVRETEAKETQKVLYKRNNQLYNLDMEGKHRQRGTQ